jgi:retinol dehydrogenase 12
VYIVTGSTAGIGKEVARMLYSKNAKTYIAARSPEKATKAIAGIKASAPSSKGDLIFLPVDLSDLTTIKTSVARFLAAETKLHVLFNNAGVMSVKDSMARTPQGYEVNLGVNILGTFLFTKLLTPILIATAKSEPPSSVRVVWVSSSSTELKGEKNVGLSLDNLDYHIPKPGMERYSNSKAGNWLHGVEFARRFKADGVVSVPLNPGNLNTELAREHGFIFTSVVKLIVYPPKNGAYTELFGGLSDKITIEDTGCWGE